MSLSIDMEKLNENFKNYKSFYMGRVMTIHIPMLRKEKGEIPKKKEVGDFMPFECFQRYMHNIVFGFNKALGSKGTMNSLGGHYIIALKIQ